MTAVPVRNTPFASWKDEDAWMEKMRGPRWKHVLKEEEEEAKKITLNTDVQRYLAPFRAALEVVKEKQETTLYECGPATIQQISAFFKLWNFRGTTQTHEARDLVCQKEKVWATTDIGDGAEKFQLECWTDACGLKSLWKKGPVGPDVAVEEDTVYYLSVKNKLIYHQLWCCDAATGKKEKLLYTEDSPLVNLAIEKQPDGRILLIRDNSQDIQVYEIQPMGLKRIQGRWVPPASWILPSGEYGIDFLWKSQGLLVTKHHGKKTLWLCRTKQTPRKLLEIPAGQIQFDPFSTHTGSLPCAVHVEQPAKDTILYHYSSQKKINLLSPGLPTGLVSHRFQAKSEDGTIVHGILTFLEGTRPKHLLMMGYGAYGLETPAGHVARRWAPLLQEEWCIVNTFLRGGGDHTEAWAKAGRRAGRINTLHDFEALLKKAQQILQIGPEDTVIYGRSAGGLLVGGTLANHPDGTLMGAVYAEVPYVDELRTTTNLELPLTALEYNEFGAPLLRLEDFISVAKLSPADSASVIVAPKVFVFARTAENDSQVFAYESVKWIRRLRATTGKQGFPKICLVEKGQGHFTPPERMMEQWCLDAAILNAWVKGGLQGTAFKKSRV
jgi:protease II